jgi:hypothetical protein
VSTITAGADPGFVTGGHGSGSERVHLPDGARELEGRDYPETFPRLGHWGAMAPWPPGSATESY